MQDLFMLNLRALLLRKLVCLAHHYFPINYQSLSLYSPFSQQTLGSLLDEKCPTESQKLSSHQAWFLSAHYLDH